MSSRWRAELQRIRPTAIGSGSNCTSLLLRRRFGVAICLQALRRPRAPGPLVMVSNYVPPTSPLTRVQRARVRGQSNLSPRYVRSPGTAGNTREKTRETTAVHGQLFSPVLGCSWHAGPQKDRGKGAAVRSAVLDARRRASRHGLFQRHTVTDLRAARTDSFPGSSSLCDFGDRGVGVFGPCLLDPTLPRDSCRGRKATPGVPGGTTRRVRTNLT